MRQILKNLVRGSAVAIVAPLVAAYAVQRLARGADAVFPGHAQLLSLVPGVVGVYLRWAFFRLTLPQCGLDAYVGFGTLFSHSTVELGDRVYVGVGCMLGAVTLGDDALVGSHVSIINGNRQHGIERDDLPVREQPGVYPRVKIGRDAWIGDRAVVMADVGDHAVIGAGSVVTKPVEPWAIVAGNPGRVIGARPRTTNPNPALPIDSAAKSEDQLSRETDVEVKT